MQDNEFEKQVRQKLTGLNIDAGETVWDKVDQRLHQNERRRRWLIWIPLGLTGIFLAGIFFFKTSIDKSVTNTDSIVSTPNQSISPVDQSKAVTADTVNRQSELTGIEKSSSQDKDEKIAFSNENVSTPLKDEAKSQDANRQLSNSPNSLLSKNSETNHIAGNTKQQPGQTLTRKATTVEPRTLREESGNSKGQTRVTVTDIAKGIAGESQGSENNISKSLIPRTEGNTPQFPAQQTDTAAQSETPLEKTKELLPSPINATAALKRQVAVTSGSFSSQSATLVSIPASKRMTWGIEISLGRSGITSGKLDQLFYSPAASFSDYAAVNLGNTSGSNGVVVNRTPSQVRPGLAVTTGVFIQQPLDDPLYLKAGLRYELLTTSITVGDRMSQNLLLQSSSNRAEKSIGTYYTSDRKRKYSNRYNFIEMPVSFGIKMGRHSRLPLAWEFGVAPGILFASNALNFNQSSAIYYKDKSLFRRTQWQFFTAVPVRLFNGKAYALEIAPGFNYFSTGLFKPELGENKHLLSASISVRANF